MKSNFKKGQRFGNWELIVYLGGGGNGEVWQCVDGNGISKAIKLLKRIRPKSYSRFFDETVVLERNSDIDGIVPIVEKFLPNKIDGQIPFYVMPLAEPSEQKLQNKTIEQKVDAILDIAKTLSILHQRKIYHRDIKPANILFYNSRFCFADFGLVDFPDLYLACVQQNLCFLQPFCFNFDWAKLFLILIFYTIALNENCCEETAAETV
jgi:serine/threonine-protein kinase